MPSPARQAPFVGREHELALLHALLADARAGTGGVVLIAGEPGIGKTRLITELTHQARATGSLVLVGHAYDSEGGLPHGPFVEALRSLVRSGDPDALRSFLRTGGSAATAAAIALLVPELYDRLPELPTGRLDSPELDRTRLFDAVVDVLLAAARAAAGGLLLVLEDLHWADAASLALCQHLGRRLADAPMLLAATHRTVAPPLSDPLQAVLAELTRLQRVERLHLQPLPAAETAALIAGLIGAPAAPQVVARVYAGTDGNPFYVTEVVRRLATDGVDLTAPTSVSASWRVPEGVRQVIGSRLVRLSESARALLQAMAVLVEGPRIDLLVALHGGTARDLVAPLEEALAAGLLQEQAGGYGFAHALIRQAILQELSLPRRQLLHLQAAEAIERVYAGDLKPYVAVLAEQYQLAGGTANPEKAIDYLLRAGEAAQAAFAYAEAEAYWQTALELLLAAGADATRCADHLMRLGKLRFTIGFHRYPEVVACIAEALTLYEGGGEAVRAGEAHAWLGTVYSAINAATQDLPRALMHLEAAERLLSQVPPTEALMQVYIGLLCATLFTLHTGEGPALGERAYAIARALASPARGGEVGNFLGLHLLNAGRVSEGLGVLEQAWHTADRLNYLLGAGVGATFRGFAGYLLDDPVDARAWLEREADRPRGAQNMRRQLQLYAAAGGWARQGELAEAARRLAELEPRTFDQEVHGLAPALLAFYTGDWETAAAAWKAALARNQRSGCRWGRSRLRSGWRSSDTCKARWSKPKRSCRGR